MMRSPKTCLLLAFLLSLGVAGSMGFAQGPSTQSSGNKTLIDYFLPIPIRGRLSKDGLVQRRPLSHRREQLEHAQAYHLTSEDGLTHWKLRGLAYDPTTDFLRYTDGTVNHWEKVDRPGVFLEDGHVTHFTFAAIDIPKEQNKGDDRHGSKVIVVPFDGAAMDRDLAEIARQEKAAPGSDGSKQ